MSQPSYKFLLTGGRGRLGKRLCRSLTDRGNRVYSTSRSEVDWAVYNEVERAISKYEPERMIACASYTNVARAEKDRDKCYKDTVITARVTAKHAERNGTRLLYISSDYVEPVLRGERVGFYAECKLRAEEEVLKRGGKVVRVAFVTPEQVAAWKWVNAYSIANRWWVEEAVEVLSRYACASKWPEIGRIGPMEPTTCEELLKARYPDHEALMDRVTTPEEMIRRVGVAAPEDSRFNTLFIV